MRGTDTQQSSMFSYLSPEERVPAEHPLRPIRVIVDDALKVLSPAFSRLYSVFGRPSIAPEEVVTSSAFAGALHGSQRTDVDGAIAVQPVVPVVCWPEPG